MVVKKYLFLLLAATCWLEAMDTPQSWRQKVDTFGAKYNTSLEQVTEQLKNPGLSEEDRDSLNKRHTELEERLQKAMVFLAPSSLELAIGNHNAEEVLAIITDVPTILWQKPAYLNSWIERALYDANQAERKSDRATASTLDDIAIFIFNQMKQLAANTDNYGVALGQILQDRNPILVCCTYNRPRVMQTFLESIDTRWRGAKDDKSPIEWAIYEMNTNNAWIRAQTNYNLATSNNPYSQSIQYAQQIIATFQQKNPTIVLQYAQPPQPPYQAHYQQPPLAQLQQQALLNAQRLRQQQHIPGPELAPQPTALWKKIVVFAIAAYGFKKLYDWYYQAPKSDTNDEPDDAFYQDEHQGN